MLEIAIDLAKVGGGVFALLFIQWLTAYLSKSNKPKKVNGSAICKEHLELAKTTVENNTLIKGIGTELKHIRAENKEARVDAKEERGLLFEKADASERDIGTVQKDIAVLKTKVKFMETDGPLQSKEVKNYMFLILDDQVAEASCKIIESYFDGFATCVPANSIDEAMAILKEQTFDFCIIDYYLNDVQNGYGFYNHCKKGYPNMHSFVYSGKGPDKIEAVLAKVWLDKPFIKDQVIEKINACL